MYRAETLRVSRKLGLPAVGIDLPVGLADASTRHTVSDVTLAAGDVVTIVGHPDRGEPAPIDYVELRKE